MIGCAPSEPYDLGMLLLSVLLVRHGWHVIYLGPQVPLEDLVDTVQYLQPDMICLDASSNQAALELVEVGRVFATLAPPSPQFAYSGRVFNQNPLLIQEVTGVFLGTDIQGAIDKINAVLGSSTH
jgi:hypothetical protein